MARELRTRWTWLYRVPLVWVAATLGGALSEDWTADHLVAYVATQRGRRGLLEEPARPARYLRTVIADALTVGGGEPPWPTRLVDQARRAAVFHQAAGLAMHRADRRSEHAAQAAAAVPGHTNAAVRALRQRWSHAATSLDDTEWPPVRQPGSGLPQ